MEKDREVANKPEGSLRARNSGLWRSIWQQQLPNAEKHFLWRACHEILPTKVSLYLRKVTTDSSYPICEKEDETVFHVLWQCPAARDVWSVGCTKFQKSCFRGPNFLQVVEGMLIILIKRNLLTL